MKCSGRQHQQPNQKTKRSRIRRHAKQWYKYLHVWPFDSLWILSFSLYQSNFQQSVRWFVLSKWKLITFITPYWLAHQCAEIRIEKNRNHLRESNKCVAFYLKRFFLEIGKNACSSSLDAESKVFSGDGCTLQKNQKERKMRINAYSFGNKSSEYRIIST